MRLALVVFLLCVSVCSAQWVQTDWLFPKTNGSRFGESLLIDGDWVFVGAPNSDVSGPNSGAVFAFRRVRGVWVEWSMILPQDGQIRRGFGGNIAKSGSQFLVTASGVTDGASGALYVFEQDGDEFMQRQVIEPSREDGRWFGRSLSVDGDRLVVGARSEDSSEGSVYVYQCSAGVWSEVTRIVPPDPEESSQFGSCVVLQGVRMLIGRPDDQDSFAGGSAYSYRRYGDVWVFEQKILPRDVDPGSGFGQVHLLGDMALIGAPGADLFERSAGAVYVYERIEGAWVETQVLSPPTGERDQSFGREIVLEPTRAFIGATGTDDGTGAVYEYALVDGAWTLQGRLPLESQDPRPGVGGVIAVSGDLLGVGMPDYWRPGFPDRGAVSMYRLQCRADVDGDGDIDADDFFAFLDAFADGALDECDIDGDGDCDAEDFFLFLDLFDSAC